MIYYAYMDSPIGDLLLTSDGESLTGLFMNTDDFQPDMNEKWIRDPDSYPLAETKRQMRAYFSGELTEFDLPLKMLGTEFQRRVWKELTAISYGATISYGELAGRVGNPKAQRAVGLANGQNPVSIVVPCHRVIGANGKLVGYGGGLPRKQALLEFEGSVIRNGPHEFGQYGKQAVFELL